MRIQTWHEKRLKESAEYARAHEEISLAQWIADFVVDERVARGWTQAQLAEVAGTTQATVSLVENGDANPRLDTLARLIAAFESPAEAFGEALAAAAVGGEVLTADVFAMLGEATPTMTDVAATEVTASPTDEAEPVDDAAGWHKNVFSGIELAAA